MHVNTLTERSDLAAVLVSFTLTDSITTHVYDCAVVNFEGDGV